MDFEGALPCLLPLVVVGWAIIAIRERSTHKSWLDNLYFSLVCILTGGLFGLPMLVSIITHQLYASGILISDPKYVLVYNGIPFIGEAGGIFVLIGEWVLVALFFYGLYLLVDTLIRRVRGDKSHQ